MPVLIYAILSVVLSGAGQLLLRRGAMAVAPIVDIGAAGSQTWITLLINGWIAAGLAAWVAATLLWILVLNRAPLSFVYLLSSLNYLIVPLLSRRLFAEPISRAQLAGMALIAVGVLVTLAGRAGDTHG